MQSDGNDIELCKLEVIESLWERLHRVFPSSQSDLKPGHILIELMDGAGENILSEEPIVIPDHQAHWLLKDFFKLPRKVYSLVRLDLSTEE